MIIKRTTLILIYWCTTLTYIIVPALIFSIAYIFNLKTYHHKEVIGCCGLMFAIALILGLYHWLTGNFSKNNQNLY